MQKALLLLLLFPLAILGCKSKPAVVLKNPGPPSLAQGWELVSSRDGSVSIAAASGWGKNVPGLMPTTPLGDDSGATADPQLGALSKQMDAMDEEKAKALEAEGILITLYDQSSRPIVGEEVTRYYVAKKHDSGNVTMEEAIAPYAETTGKPRTPEKVQLPIGEASLFAMVHNLRDGGVVHEWTYVIPSKDDVYSVTFVTEADSAGLDQIRSDVMNSLRIKG
jgi:hypothetical protein